MGRLLFTAGGHPFDEATSSLQKAIRRGQEFEAVYWAQELESKFYKYIWRRLEVISHEDIGLANPQAVIFVRTAKEQYMEMRKDKHKIFSLALINAVVYLCRSPKTRLADHLLCAVYGNSELKLDPPDEALDMHTRRGRKMGRGLDHFYDEAAKIKPDANMSEYEEMAIEADKVDDYRDWWLEAKAALRGETVKPKRPPKPKPSHIQSKLF